MQRLFTSHRISRCSAEAFALTLPFSLGHEITVLAPRYYSYKYCKLHIWATFSIVFQHKPDRYLFKGKPIAWHVIYGSIFRSSYSLGLFLRAKRQQGFSIKWFSPILALLNLMGWDPARTANYKSCLLKYFGCSEVNTYFTVLQRLSE